MRFFIMNYFSRNSYCNSYRILSVYRPFSFFEFVEKEFQNLSSLKRIFSQVRQLECKTVILEKIYESIDLMEENEDLSKYTPNYIESVVYRLSFFSSEISKKSDLDSTTNDCFLGYAIIKDDKFKSEPNKIRVYESVLMNSRHPNNFIRGSQKWICCIIGYQFSVYGYLYAQQNTKTNVCAHVALRTVVARYHKNQDMSYREMNDLIGKNHTDNKASIGLSKNEMVQIIKSTGAGCYVGAFNKADTKNIPFQKILYGCIESGFPAIIFFGTVLNGGSYHAIPVFGHTFNEDTWVPNAETSYFRLGSSTKYIPSESWMSMFVAHDDNFGSNFCIPHRFLNPKRLCEKESGERELCRMDPEGVVYLIATLPGEIKLLPINAEALGAHFLISLLEKMPVADNKWFGRLKYYAYCYKLVLRPILVSKFEYIKHLKELRDWENDSIDLDLIKAFDTFMEEEPYWLVELSIPELFPANKRKVGEVLIRGNIDFDQANPFNSFVMARLPCFFALYSNGTSNNPNYEFIPSGINGHVAVYMGSGYQNS